MKKFSILLVIAALFLSLGCEESDSAVNDQE
jgi:hypothetical protein